MKISALLIRLSFLPFSSSLWCFKYFFSSATFNESISPFTIIDSTDWIIAESSDYSTFADILVSFEFAAFLVDFF